MTTPDQLERIRGHLATLMHELRPEWDIAGCVAALRKLAPSNLPPAQLAIAAVRYCSDDANLTPAMLADLNNRAWDSDGYPPCRTHPRAARRTNGECAGCYADRQAATDYVIPRRQGVPPAPDVRAQLLDAIHPQRPDDPERATDVDATSDTATPTETTAAASGASS